MPGRRHALVRGARQYQEVTQALPAESTEALGAWARHNQVTLSTVVQGAWALVLGRYSGQREVLYGLTIAERPAEVPNAERMVGLLLNTVPMRVRISGEASPAAWLQGLQTQQLMAQRYGYAPLSKVQTWSGVPAGVPLFESLVVFENYPQHASTAGSATRPDTGLRFDLMPGTELAHYPLTLAASPAQQMSFKLLVDLAIVDGAIADKLLTHLFRILEVLTHGVDRVELLLSVDFGVECRCMRGPGTLDIWPHAAYVQVAAQSELIPDAVAVVDGDVSLTYAALERRANALGHYLKTRIALEARVAVYLPRSAELLVALLGLWKAGGVYVPLDIEAPSLRLVTIVADAKPSLLITAAGLFPDTLRDIPVVLISEYMHSSVLASPRINPPVGQDEMLAYLIYTSGSTGRPKGVAVSHAAFRNILCMSQEWLSPGDVMPTTTATGFDISLIEMLAPLAAGATLHMWGRPQILEMAWLAEALTRVTVFFAVPSLMAEIAMYVREYPDAAAPAVRCALVGGEQVSATLLQLMTEAFPSASIQVLYGPTETAIIATVHNVDPAAINQNPMLGRPVGNTWVSVLKGEDRPVLAGLIGQLYIGGAGVARGYWNQPALTAAHFVPDPYSAVPGARLYRTGDVVRWRADGELEFVGRKDQQVKVRGYRVELGEIEAALRQHPEVQDAVVVAREESSGGRMLVAYVANPSGSALDPGPLRSWLQSRLPDYMLPAHIVGLTELPLNSHGKIDRTALPVVFFRSSEVRLPVTETERKIAAIWSDVLHRPTVGIDENFFELGGDSVLSLQMVSRARQQGLVVAAREVFEHPTVASLAAAVERAPRQIPLPASSRFARPPAREAYNVTEGIARMSSADFPLATITPALLAQLPENDRPLEDIYRTSPLRLGCCSTAWRERLTACISSRVYAISRGS